MNITEHKMYLEDVIRVCQTQLPWELIRNKTILITGASGMIGSFIVDVLMKRNELFDNNCRVIAVVRNIEFAKKRFQFYLNCDRFQLVKHDINEPLPDDKFNQIDYLLHLASNTHPISYASDPIGTITANIIGTHHLLQFSLKHKTERFVFASSVEIYGEGQKDAPAFREEDCGYINCNTLRAGYPESKRAAEALCQAYKTHENSHIVIPRLSRVYGPTLLLNDSKAISQFIKKAVMEEDIILKSLGNQYYSYCYVADAASGIITAMFMGKDGEAYNISDENSNITLKNLAMLLARQSGIAVRMELPDELEQAGYSKATVAVLDNSKIKKLGWSSMYDIGSGLSRTVAILKDVQ